MHLPIMDMIRGECVFIVAMSFLTVLSIFAFMLVFIKAGFFDKLLVKYGFRKKRIGTNWTAFSWESCLAKLAYKADVVFFGDSLTRGGDFHKICKNSSVVNLGCSGDTLAGMIGRASTVQMLSPQKVFIMGGINGLTDYNVLTSVSTYEDLLESMEKLLPAAKFYIQGLLPLSAARARKLRCSNSAIVKYNEALKVLANKRGHIYIDLFSLYLRNGELDPEVTVEGLHLKPEGYERWYQAVEQYLH